MKDYEINYSCWIDKEGKYGLDGDFDTEEEAIAYCKDNNYYSVEKQYFDETEKVKKEEVFVNPEYVDVDDVADAYEDEERIEYVDDDPHIHLATDDMNAGQWYEGLEDEGDVDYIEEKVEDYSDDYVNEKYDNLIGKKIRIINMEDPYTSERYAGREGIIETVATDPSGDVYYDGTWGNLSVYPSVDEIEFIEEEVKEGLFDPQKQDEEVNYGHKAWVLNQIISSMNDETAYYDTEWLYTWPDGETEKQCDEDFGDEESFKDLEDTFISIYKYNNAKEGEDPEEAELNFHRDGLYHPTKEAVQVAHEYDKKLGLQPIQVIGDVKEDLNEEKHICCICGEEYTGYGNDAEPYKEGRCCDECNKKFVIPDRIQKSKLHEEDENTKQAVLTDDDWNKWLEEGHFPEEIDYEDLGAKVEGTVEERIDVDDYAEYDAIGTINTWTYTIAKGYKNEDELFEDQKKLVFKYLTKVLNKQIADVNSITKEDLASIEDKPFEDFIYDEYIEKAQIDAEKNYNDKDVEWEKIEYEEDPDYEHDNDLD